MVPEILNSFVSLTLKLFYIYENHFESRLFRRESFERFSSMFQEKTTRKATDF